MKTHHYLSLVILSILSSSLNAQILHVDEDFNSSSLPSGWTTNAITGTHTWEFGLDGSVDHAGNNNLDGTAMAYFDDSKWTSSSTNDHTSLTSPLFDNSANGITNLEFDYNFRHFGATVPDEFYVEVFDGTNWNKVFSKTTDDCGNYTLCGTSYPHASINISSYSNSNCQVRFVYDDGGDWSWYAGLDNVKVSSPHVNDVGVSKVLYPHINTCGLTASDSIKVIVQNYGSSIASSVPVSFRVNNGNIVTETISNILPFDSVVYTFSNTANFLAVGNYGLEVFTSYTVDNDFSNDSIFSQIQNSFGYSTTYIQDFESGLSGWTISGTNATLALGVPSNTIIDTAVSGVNAIVTNLNGTHNNDENSFFASPCFDFSNNNFDPELRFSLVYNTIAPFDYLWLEMTTDGGQNWTKILGNSNSTNWYNNLALQAWSGNSNGWIDVKTQLLGLAGVSNVKFRFRFLSDSNNSLEGIGIDDFVVIEKPAIDAELSRLEAFTDVQGCDASGQAVTIKIYNHGINPITSFNAGYAVNNGINRQHSSITPATPILPNTYLLYTFPYDSALITLGSGSYDIRTWISIPGDNFNFNDTLGKNNLPFTIQFNSIPHLTNWGIGNWASPFSLHPNGWKQTVLTNEMNWNVNSNYFNTGNTGPFMGKYTQGFAQIQSNLPSTQPAIMESPYANLNGTRYPVLSYWYHMYGATIGTLRVDICDGTNWVTIDSISGQQQTSKIDPWINRRVDLRPYIGSIVKVRFVAEKLPGNLGNIAVDEIEFYDIPDRDAALVDITSATEDCRVAGKYDLSISIENRGYFPIPQDSLVVAYQINQQAIVRDTISQNLQPSQRINYTFTNQLNFSVDNAVYGLKVWTELNGDNRDSNNIIRKRITKSAVNISNSGFDVIFNGSQLWSSVPGGVSSSNPVWNYATSAPFPLTGPDSGKLGWFFYFRPLGANGFPGVTGIATLESRCIDLSSMNSAVLSFWYHKYGADMTTLYIDFYNPNTESWILGTGVIPGQTQFSKSDPWKQFYIDLTPYIGMTGFKIRFRAESFGLRNNVMAVDELFIDTTSNFDLTVKRLVNPIRNDCYTSQEELILNLVNNGKDTLDFTNNPTNLNFTVIGPSSLSKSIVISDNSFNGGLPILPGDSAAYIIDTLNMLIQGDYNFVITHSTPGEYITTNNFFTTLVRSDSSSSMSISANSMSTNFGQYCLGDSVELTVNNAFGSLQWQVDAGNGFQNVLNSNKLTINTASTGSLAYRVKGCGNNVSDTLIISSQAVAPDIQGDTLLINCGKTPKFKLYDLNTTYDSYKWYDNLNSTTPIYHGDTLTIVGNQIQNPGSNFTGRVYVEALEGFAPEFMGPVDFNAVSTSVGSYTPTINVPFQVLESTKIYSIDVYSPSVGNLDVVIEDQATSQVVYQNVFQIDSIVRNTLVLDFPINQGQYIIHSNTSLTTVNALTRNSAGANHPYYSTDSSVILNTSLSGYFYFYYNWKIGGGCYSDKIPVDYFADCTVGLESSENNMNDFALYPNPTKGEVILEFKEELQLSRNISILDLNGRLVYSSQNTSQKMNLDLNHLDAGIYFVQVRTDKGIRSKKLILTD